MYRQAVVRGAETDEFYRAGTVAIDTTEADPFTGDRTDHEDEIIGTKEDNDGYAYQWATVQLVGNPVPIIRDARPIRKGESRLKIVTDLLIHGRDDLEKLRVALLLLRIRVSAVFDLASRRFVGPS